ncbi:hypothetical protein SUGI_1086140 [Cryptomeria japonica]|nr:hypothetical protein SUGI_1086140 [Cryptomeria japonica]
MEKRGYAVLALLLIVVASEAKHGMDFAEKLHIAITNVGIGNMHAMELAMQMDSGLHASATSMCVGKIANIIKIMHR